MNIEESITKLFKSEEKAKAKVITVANFKGGVGKSTLNSILAYLATEFYGLKVLVIDSDPQANLTQKVYNNHGEPSKKAKRTFFEGIKAEDLTLSVTEVNDHLHIIEGAWEMALLLDHIQDKYNKKDNADYELYKYLIEPFQNQYDFILFDVIPTTTAYTNNCIVASDYALMPTQTEADAYNNTKNYIDYLVTMKQEYNPKLELIGIVPYLVQRDSVDKKILQAYRNDYPDITFNNLIKSSARVKTWGLEGITENKTYDKRTLKMYDDVFKEIIGRILSIESSTN